MQINYYANSVNLLDPRWVIEEITIESMKWIEIEKMVCCVIFSRPLWYERNLPNSVRCLKLPAAPVQTGGVVYGVL
jgi:hypothetical protein